MSDQSDDLKAQVEKERGFWERYWQGYQERRAETKAKLDAEGGFIGHEVKGFGVVAGFLGADKAAKGAATGFKQGLEEGAAARIKGRRAQSKSDITH